MQDNTPKQMTLDDVAAMVAEGFGDLGGRIDALDGRMETLDNRLGTVEKGLDTLGNRMETLEHTMSGLRSSVNNYLDLSDKRYLELKHRDALIANWLKVIGDKTGVPIDISQLEKIA